MQKARHHPIVKFFKNSWSIILTAGSLILIVALFVGISGNSSGGGNKTPDSTVNNGATDNDSSTNNGNSGNVITNDVDLFPSQTISSFVEDTNDFPGWYLWTFPEVFEIKEGETYYVEWDGVTYICEGISANYEGIPYTIVYLGNGSNFGYPSNDEPFAITYNAEVGISQVTAFTDSSESHILRIYQKETVTLQLKDLTVTKNGTYTASVGEAYSSVNVNVPSTGVVDFPYELVEILPETEFTFKVGNSSVFPTSPTAVIADAEAIKDMEILKSGQNGLVIWDGELYSVRSGSMNTPPLVTSSGGTRVLSMNPCAGNINAFSSVQVTKEVKLVKATQDSGASAEVQNLKYAGAGGGRFFIFFSSTYGYIICASDFFDYKTQMPLTFIGVATSDEYYGLFEGLGTVTYGASFSYSTSEVYPIVWGYDVYNCSPTHTIIDTGELDENNEPILKEIYYFGNGKFFGGEDTGEPFTLVYGLVPDRVVVVSINESGTLENPFYRTCTIFPPETKHTVQIFRIEEKIDS